MELVKVNNKEMEAILKSTKNKPGKLQKMIEEFVCSDEKIAMVNFGKEEYKSVWSASAAMGKACQKSRHRVTAKVVNSKLYLIKLDD